MASINYNDKRFKTVEADKNTALKESNALYDQMINQSDGMYNQLINETKQWGATQEKLQQEQTDFAIEKIEQEKDKAYKDFQKEGSAAYVDWQKQTDDYGSNAEKMASMGLAHSGYSEQSKVAMYNQYQNRVAMARESYNNALINFNNGINEARLQNNSALAEIRFNTLKTALELGIEGLQYTNQFLLQKAQAKRDIDDTYYNRYQNVVNQINTENSLAEQQRQYNLNRELELKKYNESVRQFNANLKEEQRQFNETMAYNKKKNNVSSSGGSGGTGNNNKKQGNDNEKKGDTKKVSGNNNKGNNLTIDTKSITALGYGPISASKLNSLVASGEVIEYEVNGVLKYKRASNKITNSKYLTNKYKKLYNQQ